MNKHYSPHTHLYSLYFGAIYRHPNGKDAWLAETERFLGRLKDIPGFIRVEQRGDYGDVYFDIFYTGIDSGVFDRFVTIARHDDNWPVDQMREWLFTAIQRQVEWELAEPTPYERIHAKQNQIASASMAFEDERIAEEKAK